MCKKMLHINYYLFVCENLIKGSGDYFCCKGSGVLSCNYVGRLLEKPWDEAFS